MEGEEKKDEVKKEEQNEEKQEKKNHEMSKVQKGEYTLLDLLK